MKNRRDFIKNSLLLAGALSIGEHAYPTPPMPHADLDDDEYWKMIRAQFPLNRNKTFLNNGTMGPSPYPVLNEVYQDMLHVESNGRYGGNEEDAIKALARLTGTKDSEITLTRNVTEGINISCWGLPLKAGDEVIMSTHEHVGNAAPWLNRAKLHGIIVKAIPLGKTAQETLDIIKKAITKSTKVIALPHIPCTIGQILPIKEICSLAREKGIFSFVDGAHPLGMIKLDIKEIGCDLYAGCCHKWLLGPKGTGFLFVSENFRNTLQAYYGGGGFDSGWDMLSQPPTLKGYVDNGHRYYYGTQNASLFLGITKAVEFHEQIGVDKIEKRVKALAAYLQENLIKLSPNIDMLTPTEAISRGAQIGFKIKDKEMTELQKLCNEKQITTRYVAENNINCLRISTHIYNNHKEIDSFLEITDKFLRA
ncbi:MAG: aminotransferase class V-fold PLP-dependent enzyme [Bacteroidia bacterium]|nr:aminotransferase class V-fold PLP-dependent enzyme [Bacteroidia bacterium]